MLSSTYSGNSPGLSDRASLLVIIILNNFLLSIASSLPVTYFIASPLYLLRAEVKVRSEKNSAFYIGTRANHTRKFETAHRCLSARSCLALFWAGGLLFIFKHDKLIYHWDFPHYILIDPYWSILIHIDNVEISQLTTISTIVTAFTLLNPILSITYDQLSYTSLVSNSMISNMPISCITPNV